MGLLGKIFGARSGLDRMRRALEQKDYTAVLHLGEDLLAAGEESVEIVSLMDAASDGLAQLNLVESERFLQAGDTARAQEHLQLALQQARSSERIAQVEALLSADDSSVSYSPEDDMPGEGAASSSSCGGCSPALYAADLAAEDLPDLQAQFELILASYPPEMQHRYLSHSEIFQQAFLSVHSEDDDQALPLWLKIPAAEHDDLYFFELGSLYARQGEIDKGLHFLLQAHKAAPENILVVDAVVGLLLEKGDIEQAQSLLQQQLEVEGQQGFCFARLCEVHLMLQDPTSALAAAQKALQAGYAETGFVVLAASLYEQHGQARAAETLLSGLPGGGCGGGINLHLAEFWLRQRQELGKVLDAFNGACRQEPDNPRWQLRVAQTYLARNWRKQGLELLKRVVGDPRLEDALRFEAEQLLGEG